LALIVQFNINITKRIRRRRYPNGVVVRLTRHVLNYSDPRTGRRRQEFFERVKDAQHRRSMLLGMVASDTYVDERAAPTVAESVDHWLADRAGKVKPNTLAGHRVVVSHISGPWLAGTREQRAAYSETGRVPKGVPLLPMLGKVRVTDLTTAAIRAWHRDVALHCGAYTANRAASLLRSVLALAEEDFGVRAPSMPNNLALRRAREKKAILTSEQIASIIMAAGTDLESGLFYAFPFLAGTRPSEQLGLLRPLLYQNFRTRYWEPVFKRLGLPYVTPHSARHSYISTLQAQGIEVGLVAKLAGHASAVVTLGHYTQAVRGGEAAVAALEKAYQVQEPLAFIASEAGE
jgi:integrase